MKTKTMKKFTIIWIGQLVSSLGSGISSFGLVVWIYKETGSATSFAMAFLLTTLPRIIFAPFAGSIADRKNRKKIIILTDLMDAFLKLAVVILFAMGHLKLWMLYPVLFLSSTLAKFQGPAFSASVPSIVPKEKLGRANGMRQIIEAVQSLAAPIIAGSLYPIIQLSGLFIIDFITFFVAILTILPQSIAQDYAEKTDERFMKKVALDFKYAIKYINSVSGYLSLIISTAVLNFIANLSFVLLGPLVMANYSEKYYGYVEASFGFALLLGGFLASLIPAKTNRVKKMFSALLFSSIGMISIGLSPKWYYIAFGVFFFSIPLPYINGSFGTLTQLKIKSSALGRVGSLSGAINQMLSPIAIILSGVLADYVFNPLMVQGGVLSDTLIARIIGVGPVRGIGLMFILSGLVLIIYCISVFFNKKIMMFEYNNPDVIEE